MPDASENLPVVQLFNTFHGFYGTYINNTAFTRNSHYNLSQVSQIRNHIIPLSIFILILPYHLLSENPS
jgi:hypothetical protein